MGRRRCLLCLSNRHISSTKYVETREIIAQREKIIQHEHMSVERFHDKVKLRRGEDRAPLQYPYLRVLPTRSKSSTASTTQEDALKACQTASYSDYYHMKAKSH
jgi:hypothetical protein